MDHCPDTEEYYLLDREEEDAPTWYHVTFLFDKGRVMRKWVKTDQLRPFCKDNDEIEETLDTSSKSVTKAK